MKKIPASKLRDHVQERQSNANNELNLNAKINYDGLWSVRTTPPKNMQDIDKKHQISEIVILNQET